MKNWNIGGGIHKQNYSLKIFDKDNINNYFISRNLDTDKRQPYTFVIRFVGDNNEK